MIIIKSHKKEKQKSYKYSSDKNKNKNKKKKKQKEYSTNNKDKIKKYKKEYYKANKHIFNERVKNYNKKNKHIKCWRDLIYMTIKKMGGKKEGNTIQLLGYSATDLKKHIENLFTDGMSWENHGEWHIDHVKPIIMFDKSTLASVVNALDNLRPLWATTRTINGVTYLGNLNREKYNH